MIYGILTMACVGGEKCVMAIKPTRACWHMGRDGNACPAPRMQLVQIEPIDSEKSARDRRYVLVTFTVAELPLKMFSTPLYGGAYPPGLGLSRSIL